jgi:hypothetical protein
MAIDIKSQEKQIVVEAAATEYSLSIDGVIEAPQALDEKSFFDGLLDLIIDYVEKHGAAAGLSMTHKEYAEEDNEGEANGGSTT